MKRCYDVTVVGAGPAGAATARDIAGKGFNVLLLEEHPCVGRPAHCAGLVSTRTLHLAGADESLVLNRFRGAVIRCPSGREVRIDTDRVQAVAIDRVRLDEALVEQAQGQGAHLLLGTKFLAFERNNGAVIVHAERGARQTTFATKLLVGADGANSRVARQLGVHRSEGTVRALNVELEARAAQTDHATVLLDSTLAPGWFAWSIPLGDGRLRVGAGSTNGLKPRHSLRLLADRFPAEFGGRPLQPFAAGSIPLWTPLRSYGDHVLLVGDAARQVKPTSGGGIYAGLVGAGHAARTAIAALERGDFSARFLSRYQRSFMRDFGDELRRGADLRRAFRYLGDRDVNRLLDLLDRRELRDLIVRHGDIDFPSRLLYALLSKAPTLLLLARTLPRFPGAWLPWRLRRNSH